MNSQSQFFHSDHYFKYFGCFSSLKCEHGPGIYFQRAEALRRAGVMQTARLDGLGRTSYSLLCLPTASLHKLLSGLLTHNCLSSSRSPQKQSNITPAQSSWVLLIFDQVHETTRISKSLLKTKSDPGSLERQCSAVIFSLGSLDKTGNSERASVGWVNGKKS